MSKKNHRQQHDDARVELAVRNQVEIRMMSLTADSSSNPRP